MKKTLIRIDQWVSSAIEDSIDWMEASSARVVISSIFFALLPGVTLIILIKSSGH